MALFKNGERVSPKTEFKKGNIPWNKGKSGYIKKEGKLSEVRHCIYCGKEFFEYPSRKQQYCSHKCYMQNIEGENNPCWKGGKPKCTECDKELSHYEGDNKTGLCQSCCKKGERSPMWKGGVTEENAKERRKFNRKIREKVLKRDNYTCQICGTNDRLQVDHIQRWSEFEELRFNIDNCRTVCMKCHYKITFGRTMPVHVTHWGNNREEDNFFDKTITDKTI